MAEPKLLTEKEALELYLNLPRADYINALRERGLIAPEPLLAEAAKVCAAHYGAQNDLAIAKGYAPGGRHHNLDDKDIQIVLAAFRHYETLRPKLTLEMVREAVSATYANGGRWMGSDIDRLHAALMERMA